MGVTGLAPSEINSAFAGLSRVRGIEPLLYSKSDTNVAFSDSDEGRSLFVPRAGHARPLAQFFFGTGPAPMPWRTV